MLKSLADVKEKDLMEIKRLAGLYFVPREIAIMLELDEEDFVFGCEISGTPVYNAFHGGRLQTTIELREKIIKLASSGSSPAQTMLIQVLKESSAKMMDR